MQTYRPWIRICLALLLLLGVGCAKDDPFQPDADTIPPARVTDLGNGTVTASSVTLTWTAPGDDGTSGKASAYDIRYSKNDITDANFQSASQASNIPKPSAAGTKEVFTVDGLEERTAYHFALKTADDAQNWSEISPQVTASTEGEGAAPSAVTNLAVSSTTAFTATLTWAAPGDDGDVGTASEYDIRYSTANITDANFESATQITNAPAPRTAGTGENVTVTDLQETTMYYFAIKTADEVPNWSDLSNLAIATTPAAPTVPVADAGPDQDASMSQQVTLTGSTDPVVPGARYTWVQIAGQLPRVTLDDPTAQNPTFPAPNEVVTLEFELVVDNDAGSSAPDRVKVLVLEDKDNMIFVSTTGSDTPPFVTRGTRLEPFATISVAIGESLTRSFKTGLYADIYVAEGIFNEHLFLRSNISVYGGFQVLRDNTWDRQRPDPANPPNETTITGGSFTRTKTVVAVDAVDMTNITLNGLTIASKDASEAPGSSIAVGIQNSTGITISRCKIRSGDAPMGDPGFTSGSVGDPGVIGTKGCAPDVCTGSITCGSCSSGKCNRGGAGGAGGGHNGGMGGHSGQHAGCDGVKGSGGNLGGDFGRGGDGADAQDGREGKPGTQGSAGIGGQRFGNVKQLKAGAYTASNGGPGGKGLSGGGGGGGGGGDGNSDFSTSGSGGGGGSGGEGGDGGNGGRGAGGSFGIYVSVNSDVTIVNCEINTGRGGTGGTGNDGKSGGEGGDGADGGGRVNNGTFAGKGGPGGPGGLGGGGGGGGGGPSIGILVDSSSTTNSDRETRNAFPRQFAVRGPGGTPGLGGTRGLDGLLADYRKD